MILDRNTNPTEFKVDRPTNYHLGFGAGPHACLALKLARTETEIVLEWLFTRWPNLGPTFEPSIPDWSKRILGAVCPETGHAEGLLSPQLNTKVINIFLEHFSRTIPEEEHAVMIWDGAGFHTSGSLVVPENVTLVQLPPYSPELKMKLCVHD